MENSENNKSDTKNFILLCILSCYELVRALFLIKMSSASMADTANLTTASYYALPFLILPFIIVLGNIFKIEKFSRCLFLIPLFKLFSAASFGFYFFLEYKKIFFEAKIGNFVPLFNLIFLMIFFVIDVIIGIVLFVKDNHKQKDESVCK